MDKVIRIGVLGPGTIFRRILWDFNQVEGMRITAIGSRSLERAREAAALCGATHAFGSYEELAACEDVDLVYIATPHNLHMEQAILCMKHGKHVLCEKPMALNDAQVRAMTECARENKVFLMEAMWTRFFPSNVRLRELIASGAIGEVRHVTANFAFPAEVDPTRRIYGRHLAGGAILDVGVYALEAATMVLGYNPVKVQGFGVVAATGVDAQEAIQLQYANGATAQLFTAINTLSDVREVVYGTKGYIDVPDFYHPPRLIQVNRDGTRIEYTFNPEKEGFRHEFRHVRDCLLEGRLESPIIPLAETEAVSRISTQLRREWGVVYPEEE